MLRLSFSLIFAGLSVVLAGTIWSAYAETTLEIGSHQVVDAGSTTPGEPTPVVSSLAIDPRGKLLAVVGDDHLVRLFDARSYRPLGLLGHHADWVHVAAFRPDGRQLATAGADGRIRLWQLDGENFAPLSPRELSGELPAIYTLAFEPGGQLLAVGGFADKLWVFDCRTGRLAWELPAPGSDIRAIAFSPNGEFLVAAGRAGIIRLWRVADGRQISDVPISNRRISALTFSPDGNTLAVAGAQRRVWLLSADLGQVLMELPERPGEVLALCFCGGGRLASAGSGNVIHLWQLPSGREICRLVGHTGSITALVYKPTTEILISAGYDTTLRTWSLKNLERETITRR